MTEQPKHCDHECVCTWAKSLIGLCYRGLGEPCNYDEHYGKCPHDTRSRPMNDDALKIVSVDEELVKRVSQ